jgi:hypothetical protein
MSSSESDSASGSGSGDSDSENESEVMNTHYVSEPSEDDNSAPPTKRHNNNSEEDKDLPMFMRLQQDESGGNGGQTEIRHIQRKLRKQKRGT